MTKNKQLAPEAQLDRYGNGRKGSRVIMLHQRGGVGREEGVVGVIMSIGLLLVARNTNTQDESIYFHGSPHQIYQVQLWDTHSQPMDHFYRFYGCCWEGTYAPKWCKNSWATGPNATGTQNPQHHAAMPVLRLLPATC